MAFACVSASNAISAAEYVIAALFSLVQTQCFDLTQKTVGIIGCGNVGSRVLKRLEALGVKCLINDSPLKLKQFVDLKEILKCDIITVHVPLILDGELSN